MRWVPVQYSSIVAKCISQDLLEIWQKFAQKFGGHFVRNVNGILTEIVA